MQRLLPDVIKDISGSLVANQNFTPTIIPEPKRLDRDECRLNLILHIENLQKHIQVRLETLDTQLELLERRKEMEISSVVVASTMQDIRSAKIVNNSLPDRMWGIDGFGYWVVMSAFANKLYWLDQRLFPCPQFGALFPTGSKKKEPQFLAGWLLSHYSSP